MFARSMSNASMSSQEFRSSRYDSTRLSRSGSESSRSRSGSSERSRLNRSFSNQFIPPDEPGRRSRNQSFASDASFHTTIEPPMMESRSEDRMPASSSRPLPMAIEPPMMPRRSPARMSSSSSRSFSTTPMERLRDTVLTSISVNNSDVSDTMLTALSTDTTAEEPAHDVGPLLYHIQPSDVLSFHVKPASRFWGSTSVFVVNSSQNACLTFKVRTSNQSGYVVKPSRGLVSTTNAQEVIVSLCAPRNEDSFDPAKREAKDGFMIEVANISRDKYADLMKLDERKRSREICSLWSLMPRSDRQSTMLSVKFRMDGSESGSRTRESSVSGISDSHSSENAAVEQTSPQSLKSVVQKMAKLSTSSSTDESPGSMSEEKPGGLYRSSDSDESAFTIAPTPVPTEIGDDSDGYDDVAYGTKKGSAVIVVSADRMDTVDFSNPKLSFFI
ncbi:unnamed protein product [Phytophthora fragariaefolia]|uniref:Unnamed protein product n=1 Tax=Phytophthora fragariaefolia TaxID=1490495 RepID=A0A9W6TNA4_9STRA|nr:unnamed protein product [Phytophthora fragariaefolia]